MAAHPIEDRNCLHPLPMFGQSNPKQRPVHWHRPRRHPAPCRSLDLPDASGWKLDTPTSFVSVQYCTDRLMLVGQNALMGLTSFYHLKADQCARLAKDEVDPRRRSQLEV